MVFSTVAPVLKYEILKFFIFLGSDCRECSTYIIICDIHDTIFLTMSFNTAKSDSPNLGKFELGLCNLIDSILVVHACNLVEVGSCIPASNSKYVFE